MHHIESITASSTSDSFSTGAPTVPMTASISGFELPPAFSQIYTLQNLLNITSSDLINIDGKNTNKYGKFFYIAKTTPKKTLAFIINNLLTSSLPKGGGWGGIRTHETVSRLPVFKTGAFNHSATHPVITFPKG